MIALYSIFTILMAWGTASNYVAGRYGWAAFALCLFFIDAYTLVGLLNG